MMEPQVIWNTGLNGYKTHVLDIVGKTFTTKISESEIESERPIDVIIFDLLKGINKNLEVLYSGGVDSEVILYSCLKHGLKPKALTMVLKYEDYIINTHDLYYAEKFCRENYIDQFFFELNAKEFYTSGQFHEYLAYYYIVEPHVASHFWLIEQCQSFPIIAGDWPWIQVHKQDKVISPWKLDYTSYERFMKDRNIEGIGNMLSYSFELAYNISKKQMSCKNSSNGTMTNIHLLKQELFPFIKSRLKSYGWDFFPKNIFSINQYKINLLKEIGFIKSKIIWGEKYRNLLNSKVLENDNFF